jgi:ribosomal protein S18 acetylase RimI-like enzyme
MNDIDTARSRSAEARSAVRNDAGSISETRGRAFFDDPMICFILDDEKTRAAKMPRLFKLMFKLGVPYGACDVTDGFEAVALWRPPGKWHMAFHQYLTNGPEFLSLFGVRGALRAMSIMDYIEKHHPKEPHYYLQVLGTDPAKQGKGFGGVVMRRHLAVADTARMPCYLESSKETNIPIYQSFGFEVTGEIVVPGGGPTLYPMWRKARAD